MKKIILLVAFFVFTISNSTFAAPASLDALETCIGDYYKTQSFGVAEKCYDEALPYAHSPSLRARAIYLRALENTQAPSGTSLSYEWLAHTLSDYYNQEIRDFVTPSSVVKFSDKELFAVFKTISDILLFGSVIFTGDIGADKESIIFNELERRALATDADADDMFDRFLRVGDFAGAQTVLARWPKVSKISLPRIAVEDKIDASDLGYFIVSPDLKTLTLKRFDYSKGPRIVIWGDCHFAYDAFKVLNDKPDLVQIVKKFGVVVGDPAVDLLQLDILRKQYPAFQIHPVYQWAAWFQKGFNNFASPNFEFLLDGIGQYRIPGLSHTLVEDFCTGLESIKVELPETCHR